MSKYRSKTVCVYDSGLFVELAATIAKDFGKVLYYSDWVSAFPKSNSMLIGQCIPGVTRIDSIWPCLDDIDLFVFPDVYQGELQDHLVNNLGKRVWGSRLGQKLELDRVWAKEEMKKAGIDIGPYKVIKGIDALREFLKENDDQYVKVSKTRGDFETFHSKHYSLSEPMLDDIEHRLGAKKKIINFVVEAAINGAVEIGYDGYCIDGKFPSKATFGLEIKDKAFVMKTQDYASMPDPIKDVNAKLTPMLEGFDYRGFISSELRLTKDGKAYAIDPCARMGSPPGELFQLMFKNMSDILWEGADGVMVEPELVAPWGAELLLHSQWADANWQAVEYPKNLTENVKLRNHTVIEGKKYVVPQNVGLPEVGAVVATGDTMEGAIKSCVEMAQSVEGYCIQVMPDAFEEAEGEIKELKGLGIDFMSQAKANGKTPEKAADPDSLAALLAEGQQQKSLSGELNKALKARTHGRTSS